MPEKLGRRVSTVPPPSPQPGGEGRTSLKNNSWNWLTRNFYWTSRVGIDAFLPSKVNPPPFWLTAIASILFWRYLDAITSSNTNRFNDILYYIKKKKKDICIIYLGGINLFFVKKKKNKRSDWHCNVYRSKTMESTRVNWENNPTWNWIILKIINGSLLEIYLN